MGDKRCSREPMKGEDARNDLKVHSSIVQVIGEVLRKPGTF
jgi:hypothetical protein